MKGAVKRGLYMRILINIPEFVGRVIIIGCLEHMNGNKDVILFSIMTGLYFIFSLFSALYTFKMNKVQIFQNKKIFLEILPIIFLRLMFGSPSLDV